MNPRMPPVYKPPLVPAQPKSFGASKLECRPAPPVYRSSATATQLKPAKSLRLETRPAPPVYRAQNPAVLPKFASAIQRMQGVSYTSIGLTYSPQEIAAAGGATAAHGSGSPGDGINANTLKQNASLVDQLQKNREDAHEAKKQLAVSAMAEKKAGKRPATSTLKKGVKDIYDSRGFPDGYEAAVKYLGKCGVPAEEAEKLAEDWAPV